MDTEELRFDAITRAMAHLGVDATPAAITALAASIVAFVEQPIAAETGGKKWTPERKALLRELYLAGVPQGVIAAQLNSLPGPPVTGHLAAARAASMGLRRSTGTPEQLSAIE